MINATSAILLRIFATYKNDCFKIVFNKMRLFRNHQIVTHDNHRLFAFL